MNRDELATVMNLLEHGWGGALSIESTALYLKSLQDLPGEASISAVERLRATREYRPPVSVIREAVARSVGLLPPTLEQALIQAERHLDYAEQMQYVNGMKDGYHPEKPEVHPVVIRACRMIQNSTHSSWPTQFRVAYNSIMEEAKIDILCSNMSQTMQLESGSA